MGLREHNEVINIIRKNRFWVYGYGRVAKRFYRQVLKRGFVDNLSGFIVTDLSSVKEYFCEKPVVELNNVNKASWIMVAADTTSTQEIVSLLKKQKYRNYYAILYSMIDLEAGVPVEAGKVFPAKQFFKDNTSANWIAAIYLAAIGYKRQGVFGKDIYVKLLSSWLGVETAEKDYNRFMRTVEMCKKNGYEQDYPIQICKDLYVIDGAHRIVLSQCFGDGKILADIYGVSQAEWETIILRRTLGLDDDNILLNSLTVEELDVMKSVLSKIK